MKSEKSKDERPERPYEIRLIPRSQWKFEFPWGWAVYTKQGDVVERKVEQGDARTKGAAEATAKQVAERRWPMPKGGWRGE